MDYQELFVIICLCCGKDWTIESESKCQHCQQLQKIARQDGLL